MMPLTFPAIMGSDFAGTVAQVGAQVTAVRPQTQVYGISYGGGSYAEYIRVPATGEFAALPASLDVVHAAALPMAGMTALGALDTAALAKGAVLLIVGGAGGLGTFAIQMAARMGKVQTTFWIGKQDHFIRRVRTLRDRWRVALSKGEGRVRIYSAHLSKNVNISSASETMASFTTQWHFAFASRSPRDFVSSA